MRRDSCIKRYLSYFTVFIVLFTFTISAHAEYYMVYPAAVIMTAPCCQPVVYVDLTPKYRCAKKVKRVKHYKKPCGTYVVKPKRTTCGTYVVKPRRTECGTYVVTHKRTPCGVRRASYVRFYEPGFPVMYTQPIRSYDMEYRDMDMRTGDDDTADLQISN